MVTPPEARWDKKEEKAPRDDKQYDQRKGGKAGRPPPEQQQQPQHKCAAFWTRVVQEITEAAAETRVEQAIKIVTANVNTLMGTGTDPSASGARRGSSWRPHLQKSESKSPCTHMGQTSHRMPGGT